MKGYISKEIAEEELRKLSDEDDHPKTVIRALHAIQALPAADVAPVKSGKWEWDEDGMDYGIGSWVCGNCKSRPETVWQEDESIIPYRWSGSHFCPNCGAKMEEK